MTILRTAVIGLVCILGLGTATASAGSDNDDFGRMPHHHGHMAMMGCGHSGMMGPGMTGPGHGMMSRGSATVRPGGAGPGGMGTGMMGGGQLSDEHLDRIGEQMAERHKLMQQLAETSDKDERRRLLREHFESMHEHREGMD